jgi:hypothetical protein
MHEPVEHALAESRQRRFTGKHFPTQALGSEIFPG